MQIRSITAEVKPGDPGPGDVHADFAEVTITYDSGEPFTEQDARDLAAAEAVFALAGGRGIDTAEQIDALRTKRDGQEVTFVIHQSKTTSNCINVEIDGDLTADDPALRMHLNDNLVFDSRLNLPGLDDGDPGDLEPDDDEDEDDGTRYRVIRGFFKDEHDDIVLKTGLTLAEAQAHCNDPETSSSTATSDEGVELTRTKGPWFDRYTAH